MLGLEDTEGEDTKSCTQGGAYGLEGDLDVRLEHWDWLSSTAEGKWDIIIVLRRQQPLSLPFLDPVTWSS